MRFHMGLASILPFTQFRDILSASLQPTDLSSRFLARNSEFR